MSRFTLPGRMAVRFLSSPPSSLTAPTLAELGAGIDLIGTAQAEELAEMPGWILNSNDIPTPGYSGHQVGNVPGDETYPNSSMAFYKDDTVSAIYDALVKGATGHIAIMRDGEVATEECELFPVTVKSRVRRPARDQAHIFDVNMSIGVPYDATVTA